MKKYTVDEIAKALVKNESLQLAKDGGTLSVKYWICIEATGEITKDIYASIIMCEAGMKLNDICEELGIKAGCEDNDYLKCIHEAEDLNHTFFRTIVENLTEQVNARSMNMKYYYVDIIVKCYEGDICTNVDDSVEGSDYYSVDDDAGAIAYDTIMGLLGSSEEDYYKDYIDGDDYYDKRWIAYVTEYDSREDYLDDRYHEKPATAHFGMLESEYAAKMFGDED